MNSSKFFLHSSPAMQHGVLHGASVYFYEMTGVFYILLAFQCPHLQCLNAASGDGSQDVEKGFGIVELQERFPSVVQSC